jgi:hypothetical protein
LDNTFDSEGASGDGVIESGVKWSYPVGTFFVEAMLVPVVMVVATMLIRPKNGKVFDADEIHGMYFMWGLALLCMALGVAALAQLRFRIRADRQGLHFRRYFRWVHCSWEDVQAGRLVFHNNPVILSINRDADCRGDLRKGIWFHLKQRLAGNTFSLLLFPEGFRQALGKRIGAHMPPRRIPELPKELRFRTGFWPLGERYYLSEDSIVVSSFFKRRKYSWSDIQVLHLSRYSPSHPSPHEAHLFFSDGRFLHLEFYFGLWRDTFFPGFVDRVAVANFLCLHLVPKQLLETLPETVSDVKACEVLRDVEMKKLAAARSLIIAIACAMLLLPVGGLIERISLRGFPTEDLPREAAIAVLFLLACLSFPAIFAYLARQPLVAAERVLREAREKEGNTAIEKSRQLDSNDRA